MKAYLSLLLVPLLFVGFACNGSPGDTTAPLAASTNEESQVSIAASQTASKQLGITEWQIEKSGETLGVRGLTEKGQVALKLKFEPTADGATIRDELSGESMKVGQIGEPVGQKLSSGAMAALELLPSEVAAFRNASKSQSGDGVDLIRQGLDTELNTCSQCYGLLRMCGTLSYTASGSAQCEQVTRCGWCFGWWR